MKNSIPKFYSIILLFLIFNYSTAQKLSIADLHSMSANKNWETSNRELLSRGWEYYNSSVGDDEHYNTITWAYQRSYTEGNKANGWFYIYTFDGLPNKVTYRFRLKEYYLAIKKQLVVNGYKLDGEEILDERVIATYSNQNYFLQLTYSREETDEQEYDNAGSFTAYEITVFKKGGKFDPNNGKKQEFDAEGNLDAEYTLVNGNINGEVKNYNPDGTIDKISTYKLNINEGLTTYLFYDTLNKNPRGKFFGMMKNNQMNGKWQFNVIENLLEKNLSYENYENGIKVGPFRKAKNDSIVLGNYKNDLLEGKYLVYCDLKRILTGSIIDTDTTKLVKTSIGQFVANKKQGLWKNYHLSGLIESEGSYVDSLKTGKWNYYYDKYTDKNGIELENSQKLYLVRNYNLGKLDGESILYYNEEKEEVECDDGNNIEKCYQKIFVKILEKSNYKNGILHGPYEISNDKNQVTFKGQYLDGEQSGRWTIKNDKIIGSDMEENFEIGNFQQGKRQGKWERFDLNNQIIASYNYTDDLLDGEQITFFKNKSSIKRNFDQGQFNNMTVFDSIGNKKTNYALYEISGTNYLCKVSSFELDKIAINTYKVSLAKDTIIRPKSFDSDFKELSETEKVLHGYHEVKSNDNNILEQGNYENNIKNGTWSNYYYDQNVKTEFDYAIDGSIQKEYYFDLKKKEPFSGEFIFKTEDSAITEERKIKEGVRNGTTRFLDSNDKTIKKESYKDGVLKV
jgi:antitoxin component YwqK of YwqJK toxin-antitoxin module